MIIVCGLANAQTQINIHGAESVIGILSPDMPHPSYDGISPEQHLRLTFNDINAETEGLTAVQNNDAEKLITFIRQWDRQTPLLIHCWAGISRSTASAYIAMCMLKPEVGEFTLAKQLREASPSATPNRLITAKVDKILGRKGRMLNAIESIGRGANAYEGRPFILDF
jgi:predicted protein tyrosine phosphatase